MTNRNLHFDTKIIIVHNIIFLRSMYLPVHHSIYYGYDGNQTYNQRQSSADNGDAEIEIDLLQGMFLCIFECRTDFVFNKFKLKSVY